MFADIDEIMIDSVLVIAFHTHAFNAMVITYVLVNTLEGYVGPRVCESHHCFLR